MKHVEVYPIRIIHWDYNPELFIPEGKHVTPALDVFPTHHSITEKKTGIRFRWTFRYHSGDNLVLSFIGEQNFGIEKVSGSSIEELKRIVWESWLAYSGEYFKKAKEYDIKVGFALFDMTPKQLQQLSQSLKDQ